jgi:hypothetical protein
VFHSLTRATRYLNPALVSSCRYAASFALSSVVRDGKTQTMNWQPTLAKPVISTGNGLEGYEPSVR